MARVDSAIVSGTHFILSKYPFINALSLLMLLGERAKHESSPPIPAQLVYAHMGLFLLSGFLLSANIARKQACLLYSGQLIYFAYSSYTNKALKYRDWQRIQMVARQLGCVGIFVLFSHINTPKEQRSSQMRRIGEIVVGIFLFMYAYIINNSNEYRQGFMEHFLNSDWLRYLVTMAIMACALCYMSSYFIRDMSVCAAVVLAVVTVVMDADVNYWTQRGIHFWGQIRLILDSVCAIVGLTLFSRVFENRIKLDRYEQ